MPCKRSQTRRKALNPWRLILALAEMIRTMLERAFLKTYLESLRSFTFTVQSLTAHEHKQASCHIHLVWVESPRATLNTFKCVVLI